MAATEHNYKSVHTQTQGQNYPLFRTWTSTMVVMMMMTTTTTTTMMMMTMMTTLRLLKFSALTKLPASPTVPPPLGRHQTRTETQTQTHSHTHSHSLSCGRILTHSRSAWQHHTNTSAMSLPTLPKPPWKISIKRIKWPSLSLPQCGKGRGGNVFGAEDCENSLKLWRGGIGGLGAESLHSHLELRKFKIYKRKCYENVAWARIFPHRRRRRSRLHRLRLPLLLLRPGHPVAVSFCVSVYVSVSVSVFEWRTIVG